MIKSQDIKDLLPNQSAAIAAPNGKPKSETGSPDIQKDQETIRLKNSMIKSLGEIIKSQELEIKKMEALADIKQLEIDNLKHHIQRMESSRGWKLLNFYRTLLRRLSSFHHQTFPY